MKKTGILFLLAICLPFAAVGGGESYDKEIVSMTYQGVPVTIHARYTLKNGKRNCSVRNIFDGKADTEWCTRKLEETYNGQFPSLLIQFDREVYLDGISIRTGCGKGLRGVVSFLGTEKTHSAVRTLEFTEHHKLKRESTKQSINLRGDTIYDLFPARSLRLEIYDTHAGELEVCLSELELKLRRTLEYTPGYSWKEVKAYIDANADWWKTGGGWDFRKRDTKDVQILNESHFTALTYYTIRGNKEAARLFFGYEPISAGDSAIMANYYKPLMRGWLKRKNQN